MQALVKFPLTCSCTATGLPGSGRIRKRCPSGTAQMAISGNSGPSCVQNRGSPCGQVKETGVSGRLEGPEVVHPPQECLIGLYRKRETRHAVCFACVHSGYHLS